MLRGLTSRPLDAALEFILLLCIGSPDDASSPAGLPDEDVDPELAKVASELALLSAGGAADSPILFPSHEQASLMLATRSCSLGDKNCEPAFENSTSMFLDSHATRAPPMLRLRVRESMLRASGFHSGMCRKHDSSTSSLSKRSTRVGRRSAWDFLKSNQAGERLSVSFFSDALTNDLATSSDL